MFEPIYAPERAPHCSDCKERMIERMSKHGHFFGCKNYPECDQTENIDQALADPSQP